MPACIIVCCSIWGLASCAESLPVVEDPVKLFSTSFKAYHFVRPNISQYTFDFYIVYQNYDEVIQGNGDITGELTITWLNAPLDMIGTRTIKVSSMNLHRNKSYDAATNILTLMPGDTLIFRVEWDLKTDDSTLITDRLSYIEDHLCLVKYNQQDEPQKRLISVDQPLRFTFQVGLWQQKAKVKFTREDFQTCFVKKYISSDCDDQGNPVFPYWPIPPENPCEYVK